MIELVVDLPGRPPTPNRRANRWAEARSRKEWRGWTYLAALEALRSSGNADDYPLEAVVVEPVFYVRTARRRDDDNLVASLKPLLDGLVDARVVADDRRERLRLERPRVVVGSRDGIRLVVREASEGPLSLGLR